MGLNIQEHECLKSARSSERQNIMGPIQLYKKLVLVLLILLANNFVLETYGADTSVPRLAKGDEVAVEALKKLTEVFTSPRCNNYTIKCNCSTTYCYVTSIDLSNQKLSGRIPLQLGNLAHLISLDLSDNNLNGPVPPSFLNLTMLVSLDLSSNYLDGNIPKFLGQMESLESIYLEMNWFTGQIPRELGALPSLSVLDMSNNLLSGVIPQELGNISNLQTLNLNDNQLSDHIPDQLGNLTQLEYLDLSTNNFVGELPQTFNQLTELTSFFVQGNSLSGEIPKLIANWKEVHDLLLLGNNFEGPLPKEISSLKSVLSLHVANLATAIGIYEFPDLLQLTSLQSLTLRNCSLHGPIPRYIWEHHSLNYLDLSFNRLSGKLPNSISTSFTYIFLRENKLTGLLPGWLVKRKNSTPQQYLDFSENLFTKTTLSSHASSNQDVNIFSGCSNRMYTTNQRDGYCYHRPYDRLFINCGGKSVKIGDKNYYADQNPHGASTFYMDKTGGWGYSSMGRFLYSSTTGPQYIVKKTCNLSMVESILYESARVAPISLKYYGFSFIKGNYTVKLHFAEISVPVDRVVSMKKFRRVFDIDIQGKNFKKNFNIEEAAKGADKEEILQHDVFIESQLEIHLYWSGNGSTLYPENYGPLISAISVVPVPKPQTHSRKLSSAVIVGITGSSLFFLALLLLFLWKLGCLGSKRTSKEELKATELFPGGVYTFRQIKAATQNFNVANKLGEGGFGPVYKGVLPNGAEIAVKQLSAKSKQGIHEFVNEIGTISALQHPNLVKLMGCCAEDNELLLIYEYMENNSLNYALFGSEELRSRLNWSTRVNIILGIAKGLVFLHEESKLKIIHRDIKPTNILLDKDLNAKITDFGYAKLNEGESTHVITKIAGTLGYMAPEYAMRGYLTPKSDVYSFGVVTLEIVSGRNSASYRPSDQTVYLLDLAYVLHEQGNLMELVDPKLGSDYSWTEAATILELAMMCTNPSPTLRPTMSEVVKVVEGKTKIKTTSSTVRHSTDDIVLTKAMAALSQSSQSEGNSMAGPSEATPSSSNNNISNEI